MTVEGEVDWLSQPTKPKRRRASPERAAQVSVVDFLRHALPAGSVVAAVKNEHGATGKTEGERRRFGAKRKAEGVSTGFPDLILCLPNARAVFLEMKAPKTGRVSDKQRERHTELRALGFEVAVATSQETAEAELRLLGIPLRARTAF